MLKKALNHGLALKTAHRVNKFNLNAWLKPDIDMNTCHFNTLSMCYMDTCLLYI